MIIKVPAAIPVTRVTMPTARLQAPVLAIVLYILSFMAKPPILLRTDGNNHQWQL